MKLSRSKLPPAPVSSRPTFGVEIEGVGLPHEQANKLAKLHGWRYVDDSSLRDDRPAHAYRTAADSRTGEAVSPILRHEKRHFAPQMLEMLRAKGMRVNASCGQHLHLAGGTQVDPLLHLLAFWYQHEFVIDRMLGKRLSRASYAQMLPNQLMCSLAAARPRSVEALRRAWAEGCRKLVATPESRFFDQELYGVMRYWGLNFASLEKHGTVEFRVFEGTLEPRRMEANIELAYALFDLAQGRGVFTDADWDKLAQRPTASIPPAEVLGALRLRPWVAEHFRCMEEQSMWALRSVGTADMHELLEVAPLWGEPSLYEGWLEAAHRSAEACLTGARHVDLRGLSLHSVPPCLAGLRTLKSVDLRGNQLRDWEDLRALARGRHLKLADNALINAPNRHDAQLSGAYLAAANGWAKGHELYAGPQEDPWGTARRVYQSLLTKSPDLTVGPASELPLAGHLTHVRALTLVDMSHVPAWVRQLSSLQQLTLKASRVAELPDWLAELPALARLDVTGNERLLFFPPSLRAKPTFWRAAGFIYADPRDQERYAAELVYPPSPQLSMPLSLRLQRLLTGA